MIPNIFLVKLFKVKSLEIINFTLQCQSVVKYNLIFYKFALLFKFCSSQKNSFFLVTSLFFSPGLSFQNSMKPKFRQNYYQFRIIFFSLLPYFQICFPWHVTSGGSYYLLLFLLGVFSHILKAAASASSLNDFKIFTVWTIP